MEMKLIKSSWNGNKKKLFSVCVFNGFYDLDFGRWLSIWVTVWCLNLKSFKYLKIMRFIKFLSHLLEVNTRGWICLKLLTRKLFCELLFKVIEAGCGIGEMFMTKIVFKKYENNFIFMLSHDRHPRGVSREHDIQFLKNLLFSVLNFSIICSVVYQISGIYMQILKCWMSMSYCVARVHITLQSII